MKIISTLVIIFIFLIIIVQNVNRLDENEKIVTTKVIVDKCDVQNQVCGVTLEGLNIEVSLDKNIYYLKKFKIQVLIENMDGKNPNAIYVDFKMKNMDMGVSRKKMTIIDFYNNKKIWGVDTLLPICVTGQADWIAKIEIVTNNKILVINFPFVVKKYYNIS